MNAGRPEMRTIVELTDMGGRVALVTGGAGHVGAMACETLAQLGAGVAIADLDGRSCADLAQRLGTQFSVGAVGLDLDLADDDMVRSLPDRVVSELGSLDVVINAAALVGTSESLPGWTTPFADQDIGTWRKALAVNVTSAFLLCQASEGHLRRSDHASIINVSSIYGFLGPDPRLYVGTALGNPGAYAASKGAILQMTRWLATTLAPDIRVNSISPGGIERGQPDVFQERYRSRTPLARMATEEDLAGAVAYLASDLSGYVTGHNLVVDGGWSCW